MPSVSLRQISYFVALAEAGSFRGAAADVGVSQPSLSKQIALLEAALGLNLLERGHGGTVLTPAGREALDRCRRVLDEAQGLAELGESFSCGLGGTLRLASTATLGPYLLPNAVRRLHADNPELKLVIRDGAPRDLLDDLRSGRTDLVLTQLPVGAPDLVATRLCREPLWLAVARDHPLAGCDTAGDEDLAGLDVLSLGPAFTLHRQIAALADDVGARLRPDYEGTVDALRQMVAMGMGVTFLPALYAQSEIHGRGDDVALLRFRGGRLYRSVGLAARRSSGGRTGLRRLTEVLRRVVGEDFAGIVMPESGDAG